ncbi:hypothetical protein AK51_24215 [Serratia nematodiphila DZ0503SBS1]|nr:hypothetical protein AK51_24215 [Serratia nematodiphila DZ0503SBS1]
MDIIKFIIDFILHIDVHLAELVAQYGMWVYAILFLILFCETGLVVTPFLPGDSLLFVAGALAALPTNDLNVHTMVALMAVAAIIGDAVNYTIGRLFGEKLFSNPNSKIFRRSYLDKTHQFYEKHGGKTIILARFVPIVRTFAPFVAGMGHMSYRHFAAYNVIGALVWVLLFTYAGYLFGDLPVVQENLKLLIVGIIIVSILPGVIEIWRHKRAAAASKTVKTSLNLSVRPVFVHSVGPIWFNERHYGLFLRTTLKPMPQSPRLPRRERAFFHWGVFGGIVKA